MARKGDAPPVDPRVQAGHAARSRAPTGGELGLRAARALALAQAGQPEKYAEWLDLRAEMGDSMEDAVAGLAPGARPALARWCFQAGLQDLGMHAFRSSARGGAMSFDNAEIIEYFRQVELASGLHGVVEAADELLETECHELALRTSVHALTVLGDHEGAQARLDRFGDPSATMAARGLSAKDVLALIAARPVEAAPETAKPVATVAAPRVTTSAANKTPPLGSPRVPVARSTVPALGRPAAAPVGAPVRAVTGPPVPPALRGAPQEPPSVASITRPHAAEIRILTGGPDETSGRKRRTIAPSSHPLIGRQLDGRFTLTSFLSEGRIAQVFTARSEETAGQVAVKVLLPSFAADPNVTKRFLRAAQKSSRLRHDSIAQVFAAGDERGLHYVVSELLRGENVDSCIERRGALSEIEAVKIALQVGTALESALSLGVVHRGISPANIMITRSAESPDLECAKVTDFGMADVVLTRRPLSGYVAPERVIGGAGDVRADVYSLGALLFHLLTGRAPFAHHHHDGLAHAIVHDPIEYGGDAPALHGALMDVIARATHKDPDARFPTPRALDDELRQVREQLGAASATKRLSTNPSQPSVAWEESTGPRVRARHPLIDTVLGDRFRVSGLMRAGGMAQLFAGIDTTTSASVAIKVMHPALAAEPELVKRFGREARLAERLKHPNIVEFRHVCDDPPLLFIAMELLVGEDLSVRLKQRGRLPERQAAEIALDVCSALSYAHRLGVVHRDIKPANVMLCASNTGDEVKLLDFGIAKVLEAHQHTRPGLTLAKSAITIEGDLVGTPKYMSPEQGTASAIDHRTDLYALGVVLYELVTGQVPFTGATHLQILARHVQDRPAPPREIVSDLDPELEALILHLLEKSAAHRPQSAAEVGERLAAILPQLSASTGSSTSRWLDPEPRTVAMSALLPPTIVEDAPAVADEGTFDEPPGAEPPAETRATPQVARREKPILDPRPHDDEVTRTHAPARRLLPRTLASEPGSAAAIVAAAEAAATVEPARSEPAPVAMAHGAPVGPVRTQKMDVQQILAYARAHGPPEVRRMPEPAREVERDPPPPQEDGPTASLLPPRGASPTLSQGTPSSSPSSAGWGPPDDPSGRLALEAQVQKLHRLVTVLIVVVVVAISGALALALLR